MINVNKREATKTNKFSIRSIKDQFNEFYAANQEKSLKVEQENRERKSMVFVLSIGSNTSSINDKLKNILFIEIACD